MKKSDFILILFVISAIVASYFTCKGIVYLFKESGAVILIRDYIGAFVLPLMVYLCLAFVFSTMIVQKFNIK